MKMFRNRYSLNEKLLTSIYFISALIIYLTIAWIVFDPDAVWSPDEGAKWLQMVSIRFEGRELLLTIPYQGGTLDPDLNFALMEDPKDLFRVFDQELILDRLPVFTLCSLPFFKLFGAYGLYLLPAIAGSLIGISTLKLLNSKDRRSVMWLLIAFGSPVFIYSVLFWEHSLATCLGITGMLLIYNNYLHKNTKIFHKVFIIFLAVGSLGLSIYLRLEMLIFIIAFLISLFLLKGIERRWIIIIGLLLFLMLVPFQWFQRELFSGEALPVNARFINLPLAYLRHAQWRALPDLLIGPHEDEAINNGWLGGLWMIGAVIAVAHSFNPAPTSRTTFVQRLGLVICSIMAAYFLFTPERYRAAHGLLFSTPWTILGFTRAYEVWQKRDIRTQITILTYILGISFYTIVMIGFRASSPHGGLEWGARFALSFFPLIALISAWCWQEKAVIDKILIISLICLGFGFQIRGILTIQKDKQINASLNQTILSLEGDHVVTDLWWLSLNAAPIASHKAFYAVKNPEEFSQWLVKAEEKGVREFSLITIGPNLLSAIENNPQSVELQLLELKVIGNIRLYRLILK